MLKKSLLDKMNDQIQHEFHAAYLYLSMSAYFESMNLPGFAHWMRMQWQEEIGHAMKFLDHINERGGRVQLQAIEQPPVEFESPLDPFAQALAHEQKVTGQINEIYALAVQENDYASLSTLQWFVDEQVEEERNVGDIVQRLKMVKGHAGALLMLDAHLGHREAS